MSLNGRDAFCALGGGWPGWGVSRSDRRSIVQVVAYLMESAVFLQAYVRDRGWSQKSSSCAELR